MGAFPAAAIVATSAPPVQEMTPNNPVGYQTV